MHVFSNLSYFVRIAILLYFINSTSSYEEDKKDAKNYDLSGVVEKSQKDFYFSNQSLRGSDDEFNSTLMKNHTSSTISENERLGNDETLSKTELQEFILNGTIENDTSKMGVVKRKKRCILPLMTLGCAAGAANTFMKPRRPVWNLPKWNLPKWNPPEDSESDESFDKNNNTNINVILGKTYAKFGRIVVGGNPKYDISSAIIVEETRQRMKNGIFIIKFTHPITRVNIEIPMEGADEYVDQKTRQIFLIFVILQGRTILIFKGMDSSIPTKIGNDWATLVIGGLPEYDVSTALYVMKTEEKIGKNRVKLLEFSHPITRQKIKVPLDGGDEYAKPETQEIFVICVDAQGRTLLVFKGSDKRTDAEEANSFNVVSNDGDESVGSDENINTHAKENKSIPADSIPDDDSEESN